MLRSMTGFARSQADFKGYLFTIEMRSLNSRYREVQVKVPRGFLFVEDAIRKQVKNAVDRGQVFVLFTIEKDSASKTVDIEINEALLKCYLDTIAASSKNLDVDYKPTMEHLMGFPDIIVGEKLLDHEELLPVINSLCKSGLEQLEEMQVSEGKSLELDLGEKLSRLEELSEKINEIHKSEVENSFKALKERIETIIDSSKVDNNRLETEIALLADRHDIDEELVRLNSHFSMFRNAMSKEENVGKKLGFILQEINREVNTICSKTSLVEISHFGVSMKEEVERVREQIQNIA